MRWNRLVAAISAVGIVAIAIVSVVEQAAACSCQEEGTDWLLVDADIGFVGELAATEPGDDGVTVRLTYEVEVWLTGVLTSTTVVLESTVEGEACGIHPAWDQQVAVFASSVDGVMVGNLCGVLDAERVLAVAGELDLRGGEAHVLLPIASPIGGFEVFDAEGAFVGLLGEGSRSFIADVGRCPGGEVAVVVRKSFGSEIEVDIIDLRTLQVERLVVRLGQRPHDVRCDDAEAASVRLAAGGLGGPIEVWDLRSGVRTLDVDGADGYPALVAADGVVATVESTLVHFGPDGDAQPLVDVVDPFNSTRFPVSPDGQHVLVHLGTDPVELAVVRVGDGRVVATAPVGPARELVAWDATGRVVIGGGPPISSVRSLEIRDAVALTVEAVVQDFGSPVAVLDGEHLWGARWDGLERLELGSGRADLFRGLSQPLGEPILLPRPVEKAPARLTAVVPARIPVGATPTTTTASASATDEASPVRRDDRRVGPVVVVGGAVLAAAAVGVIVARRRRTGRR